MLKLILAWVLSFLAHIKQEIEDLVNAEMERILSDPTLKDLF
jgi:hypothetical protein